MCFLELNVTMMGVMPLAMYHFTSYGDRLYVRRLGLPRIVAVNMLPGGVFDKVAAAPALVAMAPVLRAGGFRQHQPGDSTRAGFLWFLGIVKPYSLWTLVAIVTSRGSYIS